MYLPLSKAPPRRNPLKIRDSQNFMFAAVNLILGCIGLGTYSLYQYIQKRRRAGEAMDAVPRGGEGRRVIIIGGSAAGATTATALTRIDPNLDVLVMEAEKRVPFYAQWPYAQVGHRSYDLTTQGAPDTLSSPVTWTVTRDAGLRIAKVAVVRPQQQVVVDETGAEHPYDALILACGSEVDVEGAGVQGLNAGSIDKHRICMSPFSTRDTLATLWDGDVLAIKVTSSRKTWEAEKQLESAASDRQGLNAALAAHRPIIELLRREELERSKATASCLRRWLYPVWPPSTSTDAQLLAKIEERWPLRPQSAIITTEHSDDSAVAAQHLFERPCDASYLSSVNLLWKYLSHFRKIHRMPLSCYTDEPTLAPAWGLGHADYEDKLLALFRSRRLDVYPSQRLVSVDCIKGKAVFEGPHPPLSLTASIPSEEELARDDVPGEGKVVERLPNGAVRTTVPFKMLFLDMPRRAPALIAASGLAEPDTAGYAAVDYETLQHRRYPNIFALGDCAALPTMKSYGAVFSQVPVVANNTIRYLHGRQRYMIDRESEGLRAELQEACAPDTEENGASSAGASVPSQDGRVAALQGRLMDLRKHRALLSSLPEARYAGYSSAFLAMTPWRLMWAERAYFYRGDTEKTELPPHRQELNYSSSGRLNNHLWDNTAWRDARGFLNGIYVQLFGYELMYWFVFMRGNWYPPRWFTTPVYDNKA